jgi:GH24 family phage-related lysozyme (muramidase)
MAGITAFVQRVVRSIAALVRGRSAGEGNTPTPSVPERPRPPAIPDQHRRKAAIAAIATALAIPAEGLRQVAYYDPPGVLTVCYGHTGADVQKDRKYSLAECRALLTEDMAAAVDTVERCVPGLPEKVAASFADAVYNLGPKIACDTNQSTAARMLKADNWIGACQQHIRWNKAKVAGVFIELPGLTKRTQERRELCLRGVREYQEQLIQNQPLLELHQLAAGTPQ